MGRVVTGAIIIVLILALFASCQGDDPFGATTREQVRSQAAVSIAQIEAQSAVEQTAIEADAAKSTARIWAQVLPLVAIIIVGGLLIGVILYFQGKAYLMRVSHAAPPSPPFCNDQVAALQAYAARTNQTLERHGANYLLIDETTGKRVRALPKQRP